MHSANFVLDLLAVCAQDLTPRSYSELFDLYLLPLARGPLTRLGAPERYIVASSDQQTLLPHLQDSFVSARAVEHEKVRGLQIGSWGSKMR